MQRIFNKIRSNLRIYRKDLKTKGIYWSMVHRLYKIPMMRFFLTPIVNMLKPSWLIIQGNKFYIDKSDTTVSQELILSGKWEDFESEVFKKNINVGDTVVDVGAHIGYYSIIVANAVGISGKVFAFEPEPKNFELLKKNVEVNGYKNVVLIEKAISSKSGKSNLFINKENTGDHRIFASNHQRSSIIVDSTTLDDFFKDKKKKIHLMKMDIQGAEMDALVGARNVLKKGEELKLITEFWPRGLQRSGKSAKKFLDLLQKNSFKIYGIDEIKRELKPMTKERLLLSYSVQRDDFTNLLCIR